ncbi:MAG: LD-carboxypeptidase [Myxococcota bacterium]|nr:LD-carboxypeptidase [Myxococcota bacterium]
MRQPLAPLPRRTRPLRLRVVAPGSPPDPDAVRAGVDRLRPFFEVDAKLEPSTAVGFLAGSDEQRVEQLRAALDDPAVDGLLVARGGYGATRLLDRIEPADVARAGKLVAGFSDATALHALWARAGLRSLHAPLVTTLGHAPPPTFEAFVEALRGAPARFDALRTLVPGVAQGPLLGGNLTVLFALAPTPFFPPLDGAVVLLEDVDERPYRVDRMLTALRQAGVLRRVAGVVLGHFTACEPGPDGTTVEQVLAERLGDLGVPVAAGLPVGHAPDNVAVALGATAHLEARPEGRASLYVGGLYEST